MDSDRLLFRVPEAAHTMGISRAKAYEMISRDEIPSIRIGGSIRVPVDALRDWIARQLAERESR